MATNIEVINKESCTGCKLCGDICKVKAITFETDKKGFWYPKIDKEKCVDCGLCAIRCPQLNPQINSSLNSPEVYSGWIKNDDIRTESTSGGMFYAIASWIIEQEGVVVGSAYSDDWKSAYHYIAHSSDELKKVMGSKYFQIDTAGIYEATKKELLNGKKVLFCGSPCQIAAMKSYLNGEEENIIYLDFICRSINSPLAFREYITELEKKHNSKVVLVHLKNKKYGWHSLASQVVFANGEEEINDKNQDAWVKGFVFTDLYTRDSCFNCQYKTLPRQNADITIGDFWGIENVSVMDDFMGISAVLLNSEKGKTIFKCIADRLDVQEKTIEDVLPGNPALLKNPVSNNNSDAFFELVKKLGFNKTVATLTKTSTKKAIVSAIRNVYHEMKLLYHVFKDRHLSLIMYVYLNYFCKNIIREGTGKILPSKHVVINFGKGSKLILRGCKDLELGFNQLIGSKSETHIRLNDGAVWNCNNGGWLFYNTVLEVKEGAVLDTGFFSMNGGSVIIVDRHITIGEDAMLGRNIIIYDSDFHTISKNGIPCNEPEPVYIGNHVWLTTNIVVLKGAKIESGSLVAANTVISKAMPGRSIIAANSVGKVIKDNVEWSRERCPR